MCLRVRSTYPAEKGSVEKCCEFSFCAAFVSMPNKKAAGAKPAAGKS
jgi:hypothetical protein